MSDLTKLREILDNQQERGIKSGDYGECKYEIEPRDGRRYLTVESQRIGFVFTASGRFVGIYNWKE